MINGGVTANYLKIVIDEAKARKIRVIAWFEYGFAMHHKSIGNPPKFYENTKAKGWHLGFDPRTGFEWLNPAHPDVVKFLGQMMLDCLDMYPYISGVQIDDHFGAMTLVKFFTFSAVGSRLIQLQRILQNGLKVNQQC